MSEVLLGCFVLLLCAFLGVVFRCFPFIVVAINALICRCKNWPVCRCSSTAFLFESVFDAMYIC